MPPWPVYRLVFFVLQFLPSVPGVGVFFIDPNQLVCCVLNEPAT